MYHDAILTVFVIIAALAFVAQAAVMYGLRHTLENLGREVERIHADIKQDLEPLARCATDILTASREPIQRMATNFAEISQILRERAGAADALLAEVLDRTRTQIIRVDQLVSGLVGKVDAAADAVQRSVLSPVREVSAVAAGVRTALEFLRSRRRAPSVSQATQDEEMFI